MVPIILHCIFRMLPTSTSRRYVGWSEDNTLRGEEDLGPGAWKFLLRQGTYTTCISKHFLCCNLLANCCHICCLGLKTPIGSLGQVQSMAERVDQRIRESLDVDTSIVRWDSMSTQCRWKGVSSLSKSEQNISQAMQFCCHGSCSCR